LISTARVLMPRSFLAFWGAPLPAWLVEAPVCYIRDEALLHLAAAVGAIAGGIHVGGPHGQGSKSR